MRRLGTAAAFIVMGLATAVRATETDPNKAYAITPEVGAWTICAASFTGGDAAKMAHDLVLELRSRYHLDAYVFNRGAELRARQKAELERRKQQQLEFLDRMGCKPDGPLRLPHVRIEEQFAVLVGGFSDIEGARRELARIKRLDPPKSGPHEVVTVQRVPKGGDLKAAETKETEVNPFINSFVVSNPTVPRLHEDPRKPDPFWKELNAGETYSLFQCKKPWTLVIKDFPATTFVQPQSAPTSFMQKLLGFGSSQLDANAMNAHNLAEALRKMGFEAYVLHTRTNSIVCVGGFDGPNDPHMESVKRALRSSLQPGPHLQLFNEPPPMLVPRL